VGFSGPRLRKFVQGRALRRSCFGAFHRTHSTGAAWVPVQQPPRLPNAPAIGVLARHPPRLPTTSAGPRAWGSRVGIARPTLSKGRANGRCSTAAIARRVRRRRRRCHVEVHCPSVAALEAGLPIMRWKAQRGASVAPRPRAARIDKRRLIKMGRALGHHLPEQNKEAQVRSRAFT
jgi:hypothetical protein